jgi:hypothetical protein
MKNIERSVLSSCFIDTEYAPPMEGIFFVPIFSHSLKDNCYLCRLFCERNAEGIREAHSSGTTHTAQSDL